VENYNLHLPPLAELAKVGKINLYFTLISIILVQLIGFLTFFNGFRYLKMGLPEISLMLRLKWWTVLI